MSKIITATVKSVATNGIFTNLARGCVGPIPITVPSRAIVSAPAQPRIVSPTLGIVLPSNQIGAYTLSICYAATRAGMEKSPSKSAGLPDTLTAWLTPYSALVSSKISSYGNM